MLPWDILLPSNGSVKRRKRMSLNRQVSLVLHRQVPAHLSSLQGPERSCVVFCLAMAVSAGSPPGD